MDDAVALLKSNEDKQEVKCLTSPCLKHKMTIIRIDKYGCLTQSSGSMRLLCILATVALAAVRNKFLILDTDQGEQFLVDTGESENQDTNHAILTVPYSAPQSSRTTRGQNFAKRAQEWDKNGTDQNIVNSNANIKGLYVQFTDSRDIIFSS